jgi:hypothetical protein
MLLLSLQVTEVPAFSPEANALLDALADNFSVADAQEVRRGAGVKVYRVHTWPSMPEGGSAVC